MPIGGVPTNRGTLTSADLGTTASLSLLSPATIGVGSMLFMSIAVDNAGTSGQVVFPQVNDPRSNDWRLWNGVHNDPGALDEGVTVFLLTCVVNEAYQVGDALEIGFYAPGAPSRTNMDRGVINVTEYTGVAYPNAAVAANFNLGNGTSAAPGTVNPPAAGQLVFALAGVETNAAITGDSDTTDGSWVNIANTASNSGTAATSVSLIAQGKVVTGTSTQTWTATWTGAADWAAMVAVFDVYAAPSPPESFPRDNPGYPCFAGAETLAIGTGELPIDPNSGVVVGGFLNFGYNGSIDISSFSKWKVPGERNNVIVAHDLYYGQQDLLTALEQGDSNLVTVELPLRAVVTSGTVSVIGGGTALAALQNPGGDAYLQMDASGNGEVHCFFDPYPIIGYYPDYRIVRVGLKFMGWKDDSSPRDIPVGEGIDVQIVDSQGNYGWGDTQTYGSWLTPDYRVNAQMQTRWLGEMCLNRRSSVSAFTGQRLPNMCYPFTQLYLSHMDAGDETMYVNIKAAAGYDPLQTDVFLDYAVLVVEIAPEFRGMVGGRILSNMSFSYGTTDNAGNFSYAQNYVTEFRAAYNTDAQLAVPAGDFADPYYVVVRQALPASPSDRLRVAPDGAFNFTRAESFGPSPVLMAATTLRNSWPEVQETGRVAIINGCASEGSGGANLDNYVTSISLEDPGYSALVGPSFIATDGIGPYATQLVDDELPLTQNVKVKVDGTTTYDMVHVIVKNAGSPFDLEFSIEQPVGAQIATATLTRADYDAAPEAGNGWKEMLVPLDSPITPSAGTVFIEASSPNTTSNAPWLISSYEAVPNGTGGYEWDVTADVNGVQFGGVPWVSMQALSCEIPDPDITVGAVPQNVYRPDGRCLASTILLPAFEFGNPEDYTWISIERQIAGVVGWTPVALLETASDDFPVTFIDFEAPWDVNGALLYRFTGYRDFDRRTASVTELWANGSDLYETVAPGAAFGLMSNKLQKGWFYVPTSSNSDLEITYNPLNPISKVQLHGVDYTVALRAPEERGLEVTVPVIVDKLTACGPEYDVFFPEFLQAGERSMSPKPFDDLRETEHVERLMLCLPGSHQRFVFVELGDLSVTTRVGLYLATLSLTDATLPEVDPWDGVNV